MNDFYKLTNTVGEQSAMSIDLLLKKIENINISSKSVNELASALNIKLPEVKLSIPTVGTKDETVKELKQANATLLAQAASSSTVITGLASLKSKLPINLNPTNTYGDFSKINSAFSSILEKVQPNIALVTRDTINTAFKTKGGQWYDILAAQTPAVIKANPIFDIVFKIVKENEAAIALGKEAFGLQKKLFETDSQQYVTGGFKDAMGKPQTPFNVSSEFAPQLIKDLTDVFKSGDVVTQMTALDALTSRYSALDSSLQAVSQSVTTTTDGLTGLTDIVNSVSGVYESILAKTTTQEETQARANKTSLINLDYQTKINDAIPLVIDNVISWQKSLSDAEKASYKITDVNTVTAMSLKAFDNTIVKTSTSLESFKKSVSDWVLGKMSTTVGSPESQFTASKNIFENALALLNNPNSSAADITTTQSKITGFADTFITNIQKMYGAGDLGANMVQDVVNKVSNLGAVDYQTTMLEKTTQIADNTAKFIDLFQFGNTTVSNLNTSNLLEPNGKLPAEVTAGLTPAWSMITVGEMATVRPAANDSSANTSETIAELKLQNEQLSQLVVETRALVTVQSDANAMVIDHLNQLGVSSKDIAQNSRMTVIAA
jgi:hypothetical protein